MFSRTVIAFAIVLITAATPCLAESSDHGTADGTPQEQSACRRDTRSLCRHVKVGEGSGVFLACLQAHRAKLSKACKEVLESHGL